MPPNLSLVRGISDPINKQKQRYRNKQKDPLGTKEPGSFVHKKWEWGEVSSLLTYHSRINIVIHLIISTSTNINN